MGSCCSNDEGNLDRNEHKNDVDLFKSSEQAHVQEYAKARQQNSNSKQPVPSSKDNEIFKTTVAQLDLGNESTKEIYMKLGPYDYEANPDDGMGRELRELQAEDNEAQYYGFWNTSTNLKDGNGVIVWADGSRYDGTWKDGKADGYGRLIHMDGDVYVGEWKNDKAHGKGKYTHKDGALYEGDWIEDKQNGYGVETWPDGSKYEGQYVDCLLYTSDAADE
eukprot:TRINITY_DN4494_c0_g1_i7.p1 TRINITY_DN4494_c0_g1~~TRINITY_DN4494_c0_g1_i7.p1  ORF type:complete len:220 (-),score=73.29 TRINITY_DN4494_c0_g1_i7:57-716(-)